MVVTMYELLGMVKDGKAPKKIKYDGKLYEFDDTKDNYYENDTCSINWDYVAIYCLNEEVEILKEEKQIPKKFRINYEIDDDDTINLRPATMLECDLANKINEIIDYLDYLKSKGE